MVNTPDAAASGNFRVSVSTEKKGPETETKRIIIKRNERDVVVEIAHIDFSEGKENTPLEIYCQGFGLGTNGISERDDWLIKKEASNLKAKFVRVSIQNIPPAYDEESDRDASPRFDVDARIILEALRQEHIEVHKRPVIISGYSEGAGIAISLAGEIDKQQRATSTIEGDNLPKNMLRLWSLTGVVDIDPKARGVTVPFDFLKEVSKIGLIEIIQRYTNVTGEKVVISNKKELFKFLGKFSTFMANPKNWRVIREQLAQSAEENLGMLNGVFGKIMTAKSIYDVLTQLKKIETRNPICDQLGKNWSVVMVVPRNDLLFPWRKVKATLRKLEESRGEVVEVLSPNAPNPARARRITDIAPKLFPNAGKVTLRVVGDRRNSFGEGGMQLGQTHVGPENDPEKYLPDDPLT